ncbi:MAG: DHH family phosphoesterase [Candidatus Bathyarchaeota archaeon]
MKNLKLQVKTLRGFVLKQDVRFGILFCHRNADPDSILAAHVFVRVLKRIKPSLKCEIATVEGLKQISKKLMQTIPVRITTSPKIDKADFVAIVDTSTIHQLGEWGKVIERLGKTTIVVDHHPPHPKMKRLSSISLIDEKARSTCEIIFNLSKKMRLQLGKKDAMALLLGIAYETKHLKIASSQTFCIITELVRKGIDIEKVLALLSTPLSRSERIARLKAAQRIQLHKVNDWVLTTSNVKSHGASAARGLIILGADVAIIGGKKKDDIEVNLRSTKTFFEKTNIHLGRHVAFPLGELLLGIGGGHSTAAGVKGKGEVSEAISEALKIIKRGIQLN